MENTEGDEESRQHVDRVVHVPEKYYDPKKSSAQKTDRAYSLFPPEDKRAQKWHPGVCREKKISSKKEIAT